MNNILYTINFELRTVSIYIDFGFKANAFLRMTC